MAMIVILPGIEIPEDALRYRFIAASGPGGQKVNKTASAVQLFFDADASPALSDVQKNRLRRLAGRRMTDAGIVVIDARRFRSQEKNRQDALARLIDLLRRACVAPRRRKPTRPSLTQKIKRLDAKRRLGEKKRRRVTPPANGD